MPRRRRAIPKRPDAKPGAATPESIAAGAQIYQRYCRSCHGINATGGSGSDISPPAPDLTDNEWKHGSTDGEIFSVIKNGVPPELSMEPWGDRIKDTDIWNVVNYLRIAGEKEVATRSRLEARGSGPDESEPS